MIPIRELRTTGNEGPTQRMNLTSTFSGKQGTEFDPNWLFHNSTGFIMNNFERMSTSISWQFKYGLWKCGAEAIGVLNYNQNDCARLEWLFFEKIDIFLFLSMCLLFALYKWMFDILVVRYGSITNFWISKNWISKFPRPSHTSKKKMLPSEIMTFVSTF